MKKTLLAFIIILTGIYLLLTLLDTGDYASGKKFWWVNKRFRETTRDPKVVPYQEFDDLVDSYMTILADYPNSKFTPLIKFQIGKVLVLRENYSEARECFKEIARKYEDNPEMSAQALLNVGMTYEREKNVFEAIKVYRQIMSAYPTTEIGLRMPLYIVRYFKNNGHENETLEAYREAVVFYIKTYEENSDNIYGVRSLEILSQAHFNRQNWAEGVDVLAKLFVEYSSSKFVDYRKLYNIIKTINSVTLTRMGDYEKPVRIYNDFLKQNPGHPIKDVLSEMIVAIEGLKREQNLSKDLQNNAQ